MSSFTVPSTQTNGCSIQLSYPPTNVQQPVSNIIQNGYGFYLMTPGVTFNLAYVDSNNNRSLSGFSSRAILHKPFHYSDAIAELCILHQKNNSNETFYLAIPLKHNSNAKSNLSEYLNSGEAYELDIGSDIAGSDVVYYKNGSNKDIFVVVKPVEVKLPDNIVLNDKPEFYNNTFNNVVRIKTTIMNDEIVCDYEGNATEDSNKSSETKQSDINMVWATVIPTIIIGAIYYLCYIFFSNTSLLLYVGLAVASLIGAITASIFVAINKNKDKSKINYAGIVSGTLWILVVMFVGFALAKKNSI